MTYPRILLITLLCLIVLGSSFSNVQNIDQQITYTPITDTSEYPLARLQLKQKYEKDISTISGIHKDKIKEVYQMRYKELVNELDHRIFFTKSPLNDYLNTILDEIKRGNPDLPINDIRLWVSRETEPNATSYGEGTIAINIGLIRYLDNESQVAFVLCHEISHYLLNHSTKQIQNTTNAFYSNKTQKELNEISKSEYGKVSKAMELYQSLLISIRKHSREDEQQADSLGLALLSNTSYNEKEALSALNILDHIDSYMFMDSLELEQAFNFEEYPFKAEWLGSSSDLININYTMSEEEKEMKDSLKTHPDCKARIIYLSTYIAPTDKKIFIQSEKDFISIKEISDFECVQSDYDYNDYGLCLYQSIYLNNKYPENAYLTTMTGRCFNGLYNAQKNHVLFKYISPPSNRYHTNYNQLLTVIHNLRLSEIAQIGYRYMSVHSFKDEEFTYVLYMNAINTNNTEFISSSSTLYKNNFPEGKYNTIVK